jgi:phosphocarrier protein HPr
MMRSVEIKVINKLGLHARASAKLTQLASRFKAEVMLVRGTQRVNAKSIMGVMMLAANQGTVLQLEVSGEDEDQACEALVDLIATRFGEEQ